MSKKSDTDESYYTVGTLVKVLDSETFFTTLFDRKYIEFQVEAVQRFKIQKVVSSIAPQLILTCEVLIYDEENSGNNIPFNQNRLRHVSARFGQSEAFEAPGY